MQMVKALHAIPYLSNSFLVLLVCTHVDDHADSGESSSQVLWVGRPHRHGDDPRIEAAIKGSDQVNTCKKTRRKRTSLNSGTFSLCFKEKRGKMAVYNEEGSV